MTLDPAHATQVNLSCLFCGKRFDLGYHFTCHVCGATYCYIHMSRHYKAHRPRSERPWVPVGARATEALASDPEKMELMRSYMTGPLDLDETSG